MIVQELYKLQQQHGYLSPQSLCQLAERLETPLYRLQEIVSFFPHFRSAPACQVEVSICRDMSCHMRGSTQLHATVEELTRQRLDPRLVAVRMVSCLGRCDRAPAVTINDQLFVQRDASDLCRQVQRMLDGDQVQPDSDRAGPSPEEAWQIDVYRGESRHKPYAAVRSVLDRRDPARVIQALQTAGLLGMGGAGGRAYKKWDDVLQAEGDLKFVVCNADESEPGTFKDREILLRAPHLVIEGMIVAGLVVGATRGYVYIRHEYQEQIDAVRRAIEAARRAGVLGPNILGGAGSFELEVFVSPGGYICGEQTALIEVIQDRRGEPRNRPPELQTNGLWDKPTLLNNVETLAWVPAIVLGEQGSWFARQGLQQCKGRRLFSISGDVQRPGVYEVPNGTRLGQLIRDHAGGVHGGRLKAVALSGPSGGFLPARIPRDAFAPRFARQLSSQGRDHLDAEELILDIAAFREMGLMLGAGIVVYADQRDLVREALACLKFYRDESCGKCVPCRLGTQKLAGIGEDLVQRKLDRESFDARQPLIAELKEAMELTSICGLGMVAANPLETLLRFFPEDVSKYLEKSRV